MIQKSIFGISTLVFALVIISAFIIAQPTADPYCGDGLIDPLNEECDDGNTINGDGCNATCHIEKDICILPLDIMLVMDRSGSMTNYNRLTLAKNGAKSFVDLLNSSLHTGGLVSFASDATKDMGLTTNFPILKTAIDSLIAGGDTNLGKGILLAQTELQDNGRNSVQHVMIILSDGAPTRYPGGRCETYPFEQCVNYTLQQADAAKDNGTVIFTIGLQLAPGIPEDVLIDIASQQDYYYPAPDPEDLEEIYLMIAETICPCGNGVYEPDLGEECDDGNNNNFDGCTNECKLADCGDGYIWFFGGSEECELPSTNNNVWCNQSTGNCMGVMYGTRDHYGNCNSGCDCNYDPFQYQCIAGLCGAECGNDNDCDDSNPGTIDTCHLNDCSCHYCGDGILDSGEECDGTAGVGPHQSCDSTCKLINLTYCGDGIVQNPNDEGTGGPLNDGYEECDGTMGVPPDHICLPNCELKYVPRCYNKTYTGPFFDNGTVEWIDTVTKIWILDEAGEDVCVEYNNTYVKNNYFPADDFYCDSKTNCEQWIPTDINDSGWNLYNGSFFGGEESCHVIEFFSRNALGEPGQVKWQCVFVDKTPPNTTKIYGIPYYVNSTAEWINSSTQITLTAEDPEPHPSGVNKTFYRVSLVNDSACYNQYECNNMPFPEGINYTEYSEPFRIHEESCHLIEFYSTDNVNKTEELKRQCVFVDNKGPHANKKVGEPKKIWNGSDAVFYNISDRCWSEGNDSLECWQVTMTTPISLECIDPQPHPVDNNKVCFMMDLDGSDRTERYCSDYNGSFNMTGDGYCCFEEEISDFYFLEESEHNLKYYCIDALGNIGNIDDEKFKVIGTDFDIPLYKKWNLISVPVVLLDDNPDEVFKNLNHTDSVWAYDSETGEWKVWSPDGPSNLEKIEPGWGYWVMQKEEETLTIGGSLMQPAKTPPSRKLMPGWNLIGYYGTSWESYVGMEDYDRLCGDTYDSNLESIYGDRIYCSLSSLIDTQQGYPRWSSLWTYVNCGEDSANWVGLNVCGEIDKMYAGRGYWLEIDTEDIYAPATTCIWNSQNICIED